MAANSKKRTAPRKNSTRITVEKVKKALPGSGGIYSEIARRVGASRSGVFNFIKKNPTLLEMRQAEEETGLDMGENALLESVKRQESWAVKFLLATKGKDRGYVERKELTGPEGEDFTIKIVEDK